MAVPNAPKKKGTWDDLILFILSALSILSAFFEASDLRQDLMPALLFSRLTDMRKKLMALTAL